MRLHGTGEAGYVNFKNRLRQVGIAFVTKWEAVRYSGPYLKLQHALSIRQLFSSYTLVVFRTRISGSEAGMGKPESNGSRNGSNQRLTACRSAAKSLPSRLEAA